MDKYDNTRETLLMRLRNQHDQGSWEEFHKIYRPYIYAVIKKMGMHEADCEDILQKVLLKLWEALPTFEYDESQRFRSWLSKVTSNAVMNFIRSKRAYIERLEKAGQEQSLAYLDAIRLPEIEKIADEEWKIYISKLAMQNVTAHFSGKAMKVFELSLSGQSMEAISHELDLTLNSANQLKFRVKERLKKEIQRLKNDLE
jgi:RNA polymerase sigma-70 factor (ECF subfamily)